MFHHLHQVHKKIYPSNIFCPLNKTIFYQLPIDLHTLIYKFQYKNVIIELQSFILDYQDHF